MWTWTSSSVDSEVVCAIDRIWRRACGGGGVCARRAHSMTLSIRVERTEKRKFRTQNGVIGGCMLRYCVQLLESGRTTSKLFLLYAVYASTTPYIHPQSPQPLKPVEGGRALKTKETYKIGRTVTPYKRSGRREYQKGRGSRAPHTRTRRVEARSTRPTTAEPRAGMWRDLVRDLAPSRRRARSRTADAGAELALGGTGGRSGRTARSWDTAGGGEGRRARGAGTPPLARIL